MTCAGLLVSIYLFLRRHNSSNSLTAVRLRLMRCLMCAAGDGTTPMKRRISVSRQLSGRFQRSTNRKVEGREIQQDHSQYALTYGLMLGIRVMVRDTQRY